MGCLCWETFEFCHSYIPQQSLCLHPLKIQPPHHCFRKNKSLSCGEHRILGLHCSAPTPLSAVWQGPAHLQHSVKAHAWLLCTWTKSQAGASVSCRLKVCRGLLLFMSPGCLVKKILPCIAIIRGVLSPPALHFKGSSDTTSLLCPYPFTCLGSQPC